MENAIYRTRRNKYGKFTSLTITANVKQAILRFGDSFINTEGVKVVSKKEMVGRLIVCHAEDYAVEVITPSWEL